MANAQEDQIVGMLTECLTQTPTKAQRIALAKALASEIDKSNAGRDTPWGRVAGPLVRAILEALDKEIADDERRGVSSPFREAVSSLRSEVCDGECGVAIGSAMPVFPIGQSLSSHSAAGVSGNGADRAVLIADAKREFAESHDTQSAICSERAWVSQTLSDAGHARLSDDEAAEFGIEDAHGWPRRPSGRGGSRAQTPVNEARSELIATSRRAFKRESGGRAMVCSEQAWVNDDLRQAGLSRVDEKEAATLGIAVF